MNPTELARWEQAKWEIEEHTEKKKGGAGYFQKEGEKHARRRDATAARSRGKCSSSEGV